MAERKTVTIEDAEIIFKNFAGAQTQYNAAGDRNFAAILDPDTADAMVKDGWNVKILKGREEGDEDRFYLPVAVSYKFKPPRIFMITSRARKPLAEESIEVLDWADFETVDFIAAGSEWELNGKTGTKAYLQSMYVTIHENTLERKYGIVESDPTFGQDSEVIETIINE